MQKNLVRIQILIYLGILIVLGITFPIWGIERPTGVLDDPISGNTDLIFFGTNAPDNIIVYSPGRQRNQGIFPASERLGDVAISPDGRVVWTATKAGYVDRYELPLDKINLQPESSLHNKIAEVLSALALSADGRFIAVGYGTSEDYNSRSVKILPSDTIDLREELADFSVSGDIQDIVANPAVNIFYIINSHSDRVRIYNSNRFRLEPDIIELGNSPGNFLVRPDGARAYAAINARLSVTVVDLETNEVIKNILLGFPPFAMCFNPDGSKLYVASRDSEDVAVIDTGTSEILYRFVLPARLAGLIEMNYAENIGISSNEQYMYVMPKRAELVIYDISMIDENSGPDVQPLMVQSEVLATEPFFMEIIRNPQ